MSGGYRLDFPRITPWVRGLLIAYAVVFVGQLAAAAALDFDPGATHDQVTLRFGLYLPAVLNGALWQPLTYAFLHATDGVGHILINGLMLYLFGSRVESAIGGRAFAKLYAGGVLFSAFAVLVVDAAAPLWGGTAVVVTGASGAIAAVLAAFCWLHWDRTLMIFVLRMTGKQFLMAIVFLDVLRSLMSNVSLAAHLGGTVFGLLWISGWWNPKLWYYRWQHRAARRRLRLLDGGPKPTDLRH